MHARKQLQPEIIDLKMGCYPLKIGYIIKSNNHMTLLSINILRLKKPLMKFGFLGVVMIFFGCSTPPKKEKSNTVKIPITGSYEDDVNFLKRHTEIIELVDSDSKSRIALSPALQGRVMTSSSSGKGGRSYGWINRELFESNDTLEHINVYGGEERFWLGPEGGQYSIFFKNGNAFTLENWQTPRLIDLDRFEVQSTESNKVVFAKQASLINYSGFRFDIGIEREIALRSRKEIIDDFDINDLKGVNAIAYRTINVLTNTSDLDWKKETGLLSIWLLGMFNHSPTATIVIPYITGAESDLGITVNDTYFGKVPSERLTVKDKVIFFKGDGEYRSKIGLSPMRAKDIMGSYDATNGILTIVKYNKPVGVTDYVNSMWEMQDKPYSGDAVNSYNDGSPSPGKKPLGPFYELETSSPALALKAGEHGTHIQTTCHFEGDKDKLNSIAEKLLGVSIIEIGGVFK
ncbi:MAG: hypothetical protein ACJA01_000534 [Saprospiraceae bacterium]|jgi:hypothetical protein